MKNFLRKLIPNTILLRYHEVRAWIASAWYGFPARSMIVVGVTGTKGKTSTSYFIWSALNAAGIKTGIMSTAVSGIASPLALNTSHMTMPGAFALQKFLRDCRKQKCEAVVIETSSQGILQYRHKGIDYDFAVFTNLTPEHIEAHGSFEAYRKEKQKLFASLEKSRRKIIRGMDVPKAIIVCGDSPEAHHFSEFNADKKIIYGTGGNAEVRAEEIHEADRGINFVFNGKHVSLGLHGNFNAVNALPALAVGSVLGLDTTKLIHGLEAVGAIPGRMEVIARHPFTVVVDYAHEPESLRQALVSAKTMAGRRKVTAVFGSAGGGRDKQKRPLMGKVASDIADRIILTSDDSYDEDVLDIVRQIASGIPEKEKRSDETLFEIPDRREAIRKAFFLAHDGDVVMILGMGAEQSIAIRNKRIPWDDRKVATEELHTYVKHE